MTTGKNVVTALAAITAQLPAIAKADRAPQGWNYRGIEAITAALQPLLAKHEVVLIPNARLISIQPAPAMKDGWTDTTIQIDWVICGPGGPTDQLHACTIGIGRDNSDKGANKAATQAYKYLLLQLFAIGDRNDDTDAGNYDPHRQTPAAPPAPTAAELLLEQCKQLSTDHKKTLRDIADMAGHKISAAAFHNNHEWADQVRQFIIEHT